MSARIKQDLVDNYNLHTIVRLPNGVFAPYTPIPTNVLFFDRTGPTSDIWYYEHPLPEARKTYTKTKPLSFLEFGPMFEWWNKREPNGHAWVVPVADVRQHNYNLDLRHPDSYRIAEERSPSELVASIVAKEHEFTDIIEQVRLLVEAEQ